MNIVVISSTNGGVLSKVLEDDEFRSQISCLISDRDCGAINVAEKHNIKTRILYSNTGKEFSDKIVEYIDVESIDLYISFYTRLFKGQFLEIAENKIINLHPSILPACPGMSGFEDTVKSGSRFIGSTIHLIDKGMDTGRPVIQSATPYNPNLTLDENRHKVFIDQCKMLLQVVKWFNQKRISIRDGKVTVKDAYYEDGRYSPNIELETAKNLS